MEPKRIRVGVIGTGFGRRVHIPAFDACSLVDLVAVCSNREQHARDTATQFHIPNWFTDYREMLTQSRLDLVSIVTPPDLHLPMYLGALEHKVHVLCEKPLARNAIEALEMYRASKTLPIISMVNFELRFDPNRRKLKRLVHEGYLGDLRHVFIQQVLDYYSDGNSRSWDWWSQEEKGGGVVGGMGSHWIDFARWIFGDIARVSAHLATFVSERPCVGSLELQRVETEDYATVLLTFASGAEATITMSVVARGGSGLRLEAYGSEGTLILDTFGRLLGARKGEKQLADISDTPRDKLDRIPGHFGSLVQALSEAVAAGNSAVPDGGSTFYDSLVVQGILDSVRLAHKERRRVQVEEVAVR